MAQETTYVNLTGSGLVIGGSGVLASMYVNSTSSGVIKFYDALTGTGTVSGGDITPAVGFHNLGNRKYSTGCYMQLVSGTIDVTLHVKNSN